MIGLLTYLLLSVWGLGVAVAAVFGGLRRELSDKRVPPADGGGGRWAAAAAPVAAPGIASAPATADPQAQMVQPPSATPPSPTVPDVLAYPKPYPCS